MRCNSILLLSSDHHLKEDHIYYQVVRGILCFIQDLGNLQEYNIMSLSSDDKQIIMILRWKVIFSMIVVTLFEHRLNIAISGDICVLSLLGTKKSFYKEKIIISH